ncbi:MAG: repressor LexA [Chloroflexi bacterium]|nr:repressor LexA [Chloroflexota bacterium]|tara:strand:+ start:34015 stop:34662 length:648 start_codon:yes stop_codon:yes gene_type:complete
MKKELSTKQKNILDFIENFLNEHHYPPTIRDIQQGCEISSTSVVDYNLRILKQKGLLNRDAEVSRGIELVNHDSIKTDTELIEIPIMGNIAAGAPIHLPESNNWANNQIDSVSLPSFLTKGKENIFGVKVKGESMIDALVADGDLVLLESITNKPNNGDMVAALIKDQNEVTLKHFFIKNGKVTLQPANSSMKPIQVDAENVQVQGRVVGVIRSI